MSNMKDFALDAKDIKERAEIILTHVNDYHTLSNDRGHKYYEGTNSYIVQNVKIYNLPCDDMKIEEAIQNKFMLEDAEDPFIQVKLVSEFFKDKSKMLCDRYLGNERDMFIESIQENKDESPFYKLINKNKYFCFVSRSGGYFAIDKANFLQSAYDDFNGEPTLDNYDILKFRVEYFEYFITFVKERLKSLNFTDYLLDIIDNCYIETKQVVKLG